MKRLRLRITDYDFGLFIAYTISFLCLVILKVAPEIWLTIMMINILPYHILINLIIDINRGNKK